MLPYGLNQKVEFKRFGPMLGELNLNEISKIDEIDFTKKISPVMKQSTLSVTINLLTVKV